MMYLFITSELILMFTRFVHIDPGYIKESRNNVSFSFIILNCVFMEKEKCMYNAKEKSNFLSNEFHYN